MTPPDETPEKRDEREHAEEYPAHARAIAVRTGEHLLSAAKSLSRSRAGIITLIADLSAIERLEPTWPPTLEEWMTGETRGTGPSGPSARTSRELREHTRDLDHLIDVLAAYEVTVNRAFADLTNVTDELDEAGGDASAPAA